MGFNGIDDDVFGQVFHRGSNVLQGAADAVRGGEQSLLQSRVAQCAVQRRGLQTSQVCTEICSVHVCMHTHT